jgi:FtsH-binding integral membrane protein
MSIGGKGPCEPIEASECNPTNGGALTHRQTYTWCEAALLISSIAAAILGTVLVMTSQGSSLALLVGSCLSFFGLVTAMIVELRRHRRLGQTDK